MLFLLLAACGPARAVLTDPDLTSDTATADTGAADTGETADTDTDTGEVVDTEPEPPKPLVWNGTRTFHVDGWSADCEDEVTETGREITTDPDWSVQVAACSSCAWVFLVDVDPEKICEEEFGWGALDIATEILRGIEDNGGGDVAIWSIEKQGSHWERSLLADGELDGADLSYAYTDDAWGMSIEVEGEAELTPGE